MRFGLKELGLGLVGFSDWAVKWFWVWIMTRG
jgi:hypothetical protein